MIRLFLLLFCIFTVGPSDARQVRQDRSRPRKPRVAAVNPTIFTLWPDGVIPAEYLRTGAQLKGSNSEVITHTASSERTCWDSNGTLYSSSLNLILRSHEITTAPWVSNNSIAAAPIGTANVATAPDGTMTADQIVFPTTTSGHSQFYIPITATATTYTASVWLKKVSGTATTLKFRYHYSSPAGLVSCSINTDTWTRCSTTATLTANAWVLVLGGDAASGAPQSDVTVLVGGVQHELGSTATPYTPTTTAANGAPCTVTQGLQVEGPITNYAGHSNEIQSNISWAAYQTTVQANQCTYIDGTTTMVTVTSDNTSGNTSRYQTTNVPSSTGPFTASAFTKAPTSTPVVGSVVGDCGPYAVSTCTCRRSDGGACTATIASVAWCVASTTLDQTNVLLSATYTCAYPLTNPSMALAPGNFKTSGTTAPVCFGGAQFELGSYPTSRIPTSSQTAVARASVVPTTSASTWPIATGSACATFTPNFSTATAPSQASILDTRTGNHGWYLYATSTTATCLTGDGTATSSDIESATWVPYVPKRVCCHWDNGTNMAVVDGVGTSNAGNRVVSTLNANAYLGVNYASLAHAQGFISDICVSSSYTGCN